MYEYLMKGGKEPLITYTGKRLFIYYKYLFFFILHLSFILMLFSFICLLNEVKMWRKKNKKKLEYFIGERGLETW